VSVSRDATGLSRKEFDGIVCDLRLPRRDGLQLFDLLGSAESKNEPA
jgi:CheY-like chemotaxis protein